MKSDFIILSGSADPFLAHTTARLLESEIGRCTVERFPDSEVNVRLTEPVRARKIVIIGSTSPPVDEHLIEVVAIADACRRASATAITWMAPYFGYARSDKRGAYRSPVMASLVARFAETSGIGHLVAVDLHAAQIEGFFHIPVEELTAVPMIAEALKKVVHPDSVIVSPDAGRVKMAAQYGNLLNRPVVVLHKERSSGRRTNVIKVVGEVRDRPCVVIDDMISTGSTIDRAIDALLQSGAARDFVIAATHGIFAQGAHENLNHPAIREILVTNSIAVDQHAWPKVTVVSLAPLLAAAIRRLISGDSMSDLFSDVMYRGITF